VTSDEIKAKEWPSDRDILIEIATQLALLNERWMVSRLTGEIKQRKKRGPRECVSLARPDGANLYRVSSWGIDARADMLRNFDPDPEQPGIEELEVGESTIGKLGTKSEVMVTRKR
jgi:hypothetical protein